MGGAASLVTVGQTALRVLKQLGVKAGQTLLIHGAAGSVGIIAVQLAVARGITVIGTAAERDLERVTALGATAVRYGDGWAERVKAAAPGGVDFVFDAAGAGVLADSVALAGDAARVITIADMSAASTASASAAQHPPTGRPSLPELVQLPPPEGSPSRSGAPTRWRRPPRRTPTWKPTATTARSSCSLEEEG